MMFRSLNLENRAWVFCVVGIVVIATASCCDSENEGDNGLQDLASEMALVDHYYAISPDCTVHCTASPNIVGEDGAFEVARNDKVMFINFHDYELELTLKYSETDLQTENIPEKSAIVVKIKDISTTPGPDVDVFWKEASSTEPSHGGPRMIVRP